MTHRILTGTVTLIGLAALAGCQDLNVPNTQNPDRELALNQPADVEALGASQWTVFFNRLTNRTAVYNPVPLIADEMTATYANDGALEISSEPRVAFNNSQSAEVAAMSTVPYAEFNSMVASANDVLIAIEDGLVIATPDAPGGTVTDNTIRAKAFAKFIQGLGLGYLSLYFDSSFAVREPVARQLADDEISAFDLELLPYSKVRDTAIVALTEAIAIADGSSDFLYPRAIYFRTLDVDDEMLARLAHTYIARLLVYGARTPADRAAVDWDAVLTHLDNGITADFAIPLQSNVLTAGYLSRISNSGSFSARADYKMVGPADTSAGYATWISQSLADRARFDIVTPDRRITGAGGPKTAGSYFQYRTNDVFNISRGQYHFSAYQWKRNTSSTTGNIIFISKAEVDLMRAEANFFKGNLVEAARLINISRVGNGQLPPITANGDTSVACVPRRTDRTCGSLYEAIVYERTIEGAGSDALRTYLDSRGLGRLVVGTFIHLPLSTNELISLGRPNYTYGGVGGPGSVPKCTVPTLTCHPQYP